MGKSSKGRTTMNGDKAIELIIAELRKAEEKHPGWPEDPIHAVGIIIEEVGEAMREAVDVTFHGKAREDLIRELAQAGAMALRALMHLETSGHDRDS